MTNIKSRGTIKYDLLTAPLFLFGLSLLLLNDFYLKSTFHNFTTGKLSDVAGLFIFPFFISIFLDKPKAIYLSTTVFFCFWKLEISQPFIDLLSTITRLTIYRTIDYTDLFALSILPFSYFYYLKKIKKAEASNKIISGLVCGISLFAFCATTTPPERQVHLNIEMNKTYNFPISKDSLLQQLYRVYSDGHPDSPEDSMYRLYFRIPEYNARFTAIASIKNTHQGGSAICLQQIDKGQVTWEYSGREDSSRIEQLSKSDFEHYFNVYYIEDIRNFKGYFSDRNEYSIIR